MKRWPKRVWMVMFSPTEMYAGRRRDWLCGEFREPGETREYQLVAPKKKRKKK